MNQISQDTPTPNSHELEKVIGALSKITSRSPEEIKPHIEKLVAQLKQHPSPYVEKDHFYLTSTHDEWIAAFHEFVESHKDLDLPLLSDEAISRESIYEDRW